MFRPLSTQLVGSYTKPAWLARHKHMMLYDNQWWRPELEVLPLAMQDAARLAIYDQERAGLDLLTDGEAQRENYASHFGARLGGVDATQLGEALLSTREIPTIQLKIDDPAYKIEAPLPVPRIVGDVYWPGPLSLDAVRFLKQHTNKPIKANVVGAMTAAFYLKDEHYGDDRTVALALAGALNEELRALDAEGVDLLQIDEPVLHYHIGRARRYGAEVITRMVEGLHTPVVVHVCYGYAALIENKSVNPEYADVLDLLAGCPIWGISLEYEEPGHTPDLLHHCGDKHVVLGLLNLGTEAVETPEHIANRIRAALEVVSAARLHGAPDCGMWHLPREVAFAKLRSLVLGAEIVRRERGISCG
jgi:5-methyltetrahydropteroyltriglutamate--homocysteine methyltransferase